MKNTLTYSCKTALPELPSFLKHWIGKYFKETPIKVPVRQNGLTSSGRPHLCHWNAEALSRVFGGSRKRGFLISEHSNSYSFTDHSCWLTPENKLVDVTRYPGGTVDTYRYFLPVMESWQDRQLPSIYLLKTYKRHGIGVDFRNDEFNLQVAEGSNFPIFYIGETPVVIFPSSMFNKHILSGTSYDRQSFESQIFEEAYFDTPSSATGLTWLDYLHKLENSKCSLS